MPALTKKRPTKNKGKDRVVRNNKTSRNAMVKLSDGKNTYAIPKHIAKEYIIKDEKKSVVSSDEVFKDIIEESGESAVMLKGLRYREGLTQVQFAKKIGVTQANLSAMECGRRSIGKDLAKRIASIFDVNYRYFL